MFWRKAIPLTFLLVTSVSGAYAQNRFEIEPFVGVRFGGRININTPEVDYLPIETSLNWGFTGGAAIVRHLFAEFMWNRQTTTLSAHDLMIFCSIRRFHSPPGRISIFITSTCSTNSGRPGNCVRSWWEELATRTLIPMECSRSRIASPITWAAA